jgi:hypothetical protein
VLKQIAFFLSNNEKTFRQILAKKVFQSSNSDRNFRAITCKKFRENKILQTFAKIFTQKRHFVTTLLVQICEVIDVTVGHNLFRKIFLQEQRVQ